MKGSALLIGGLVLVILGIAGLVLIGSGILSGGAAGSAPAARGEWIFRTGTGPNGQTIPSSGAMRMMGSGCASCHGADGHGLRTMMFVSPNISYRNLTDANGFLEPDGTRGPTYTDDQIRRAVTRGIDPEEQALNPFMPRWQLTDSEWSDLLAYLKTLP